MSRAKFEQLNLKLFEQCIKEIDKVLPMQLLNSTPTIQNPSIQFLILFGFKPLGEGVFTYDMSLMIQQLCLADGRLSQTCRRGRGGDGGGQLPNPQGGFWVIFRSIAKLLL